MAARTTGPAISYEKAMNSFVGWYAPDGTTKVETVYRVPNEVFERLVKRACNTAHNPAYAHNELAFLHQEDYEQFTDRFYAMTELLRLGATPFWSDSYVDARAPTKEAR